jgi:hypothetical protein
VRNDCVSNNNKKEREGLPPAALSGVNHTDPRYPTFPRESA